MDQEDNDLENLDQEEAALRNEAMQIDPPRAEDKTLLDDVNTGKQAAGDVEPTTKKTDKPTKDKTDAGKKEQKSADKTEAEKAKEQKDTKPDEKGDDDDPKLTPYEKSKRRQDKAWKQITAEKDQLKKERETLEAERRQIEQAKQQRATPPEKPKHNGFTAEQYDEAAKDFEAEGKLEARDKALAVAKRLRDEEQKQQGGAADEGQLIKLPTGGRITAQEQAAMQQHWQANLQKLGKEHPELAEEGTPMRTEVTRLLKEFPILHTSGDGINYAVQIAGLQLQANRVPDLEQQLTDAQQEISRLTELTSLHPGGPGHKPAERKINDLPLDEAEQELREQAMAADARGGG